jgi:PAS domain S-box-containing protein
MNKSISIQNLIYRNYLKSSLIPIIVIEVTLLLLYFGINYYISERNRTTMLDEATKNIREIASREVRSINRQLIEVADLALIMKRDHESFFADPDACYLPNGRAEFRVHENGAYFKSADNGGGSLYYASTTRIGPDQERKALCSEMLDPLLVSIVETSPIVTQAYLNTWDDLNRLYPFMPDAPGQYGSAINMEDYNFYYDADSEHNPERKPVWTGAYLDPAGQGWMVSVIVPVYRGDFLEGVSGLDVTIDVFVQNILDLRFPWDAGTFMVDKAGTILAMQKKVEPVLGLKELGGHDYSESIKETVEKPEEYNLLNNPDESLKKQFSTLFASQAEISSIDIAGVDYLVSQEIVAETGWRMMTLIEKNKVFEPITKLKLLSDEIGLAAILAMVIFYVIFFLYLLTKSRKLTDIIATPITKLSDLTQDLGRHLRSGQLELSGIVEVDSLTTNFNTMSMELKAAIMEAQAARQEADSVISNFLDSMLVVDEKLQINRVNRETCHLLGYKEEDLLARQVSILFDEPETTVAGYFNFPFRPETEDREELRNVELTFVASGGAKLPVSINLARVTNEAGETVGVVAGAKDISELKRTLNQAEQQKKFIQNIFNTVPGGLLVIDSSFQLTRSNDTYTRLVERWSTKYGFDREKLAARILAELGSCLPRQQSGEINIQGDDDELIIEFHSSNVSVQESRDSRVIFLHDVTSRHKAGAVRKLQSTVLDQTSEGVIVTDTEGIILYGNMAAQTMSGYDSVDLVGRKTSLFKSGKQDDEFYRELWETLKRGDAWSGSIINRRSDSSLFETEMTISPVRSTDSEVTHYVSIWRDVSQVRDLQRQLLQSQKLEAVGQLAAGVAHEINNPIQYILNNLTFFKNSFNSLIPLLNELQRGLQQTEPLPDEAWRSNLLRLVDESGLEFLLEEIPEGLEDALSGTSHVARIISAMKEFAHPGKEDKSPNDLNRLIENAVVVTHNEIKHLAEVETTFDYGLPHIHCEPGAISQVLINLIINARDAIEERGELDSLGRIAISTRQVDNSVEIRVTDNGVGVSEEIRHRIFDPFFTTKEVGKGTGQGLAIAYDILVNKHKGSIACESRPGEGTTMIITLPLGG